MDFKRYGFNIEEIGEYTYAYHYRETIVNHRMHEYRDESTDTTVVVLEKETRKGGNFIRLPQSLWITREGYPPLSTDGALQQVGDNRSTLYFAGMPTVQSEDHTQIFDSAMSAELTALGMDYGLTVSCYQADAEGRACGRCDSCRIRREGFRAAGVPDPLTPGVHPPHSLEPRCIIPYNSASSWAVSSVGRALNLYPYTSGHCMVAPNAHVSDLEELDDATVAEIMLTARSLLGALRPAYAPHGFNIGFNVGAAAGAGIEEHLHLPVVPRWRGDTNLMGVIGDTRVIPEDLGTTFDKVRAALEAGDNR